MARATLAVQTLTHGLAPTYTAIVATDDAQFLFDPDAFLHIKNVDTDNPIIVTIPTIETIDGDLAVDDRQISVPAVSAKFSRTFAKDAYKQADGMVYINVPAANIQIAVLKPA